MRQRVGQNVAQLGAWDAACYFAGMALRRLGIRLYKYEFVAQPVAVAPLARGRGKAIDVRLATDIAGVPPDYPRPARVVADRFAQGALTLQAWKGGDLAGFLWLLHDGYREDEVRADYRLASPASVWDFDVYVAPAYRMGPTYLRLWEEANTLLRERGVRWTCSRISSFNVASRHAHARLGTVRMGGALFLCAGRWQLSCLTQAPFLHLSRQAAPRLTFDTAALAPPQPLQTMPR
ncbi:hypothetical protein E1742_15235 [Pseudoduganella plicata]|uniref:GNAT family N-acetyltransferase n=1 Tax=Pseudoduganella plicata TaxID=321984 RepID=A0ABX5SIR1_9BURK|nr:hypothetical protein E1742_15235 [Pseudoduganella plicata]